MIQSVHDRDVFEAFNARFLDPRQVAATFVPPPQFTQLLESTHSVISGTRGSGKTTLLKMLTLEGLDAWKSSKRAQFSRQIHYTSIFVGSDVLWTGQLDAFTGGDTSSTIVHQTQEAMFRLHVCFSALDTLAFCRNLHGRKNPLLDRFAISLDENQAAQLSRELATAWGVRPVVDHLDAVRNALHSEVAAIERYAKSVMRGESPAAPHSLGTSWLSGLKAFIDIVNHAIGDPGRLWALLVDELEISRPHLRNQVFAALRSTDKRLLIKLSLFPFQDADAQFNAASATSQNDYQSIVLWGGNRTQKELFCTNLLRMMLKQAGGDHEVSPESVLGTSRFDGGSAHRKAGGAYDAPSGAVYREFRSLKAKDPSFAQYLEREKVNIEDMKALSEEARAAKIRKVLPITGIRDRFLRPTPGPDAPQQRIRSTAGYDIYTGASGLFALSEGNPRILIHLVRPLVLHFLEHGARTPVPKSIQEQHVKTTLERFRSYIAGTPYARSRAGTSVWDFVDMIGSALERRILRDDFRRDVPLEFTVDASVLTADLGDVLGRAINLGLIVPITKGHAGAILDNLTGARCRLAFTVCPYFRLPLVTTGMATPMVTLLKQESSAMQIEANRFRRRLAEHAQQLELALDDRGEDN